MVRSEEIICQSSQCLIVYVYNEWHYDTKSCFLYEVSFEIKWVQKQIKSLSILCKSDE